MVWLARFLLCVVLAALSAFPAAGARPVLRYAIFPAPPFMIGAVGENDPVSGIDVEIVKEIARRLGCDVRYIRAPWIRCLNLLETGRADLLSSAFKTREREGYMKYLTDPYLHSLPVAFYFRNDSGFFVDRYEDLYRYQNIGVLKGGDYFPRFDQDDQLAKVLVTSQDQLFPMLVSGRLDLIAGYVDTENFRLVQEGYKGKVGRSVFVFDNPVEVYLTVSRKSAWLSRFAEIDRIHKDLLKSGFIQQVTRKYKSRYD